MVSRFQRALEARHREISCSSPNDCFSLSSSLSSLCSSRHGVFNRATLSASRTRVLPDIRSKHSENFVFRFTVPTEYTRPFSSASVFCFRM